MACIYEPCAQAQDHRGVTPNPVLAHRARNYAYCPCAMLYPFTPSNVRSSSYVLTG
jgi:hypothetical protein